MEIVALVVSFGALLGAAAAWVVAENARGVAMLANARLNALAEAAEKSGGVVGRSTAAKVLRARAEARSRRA